MKRAQPRLRRGSQRRRWWRKPFKFLLRIRPRRHHLHNSWVHRLLGDRLFEPHLWIPNRTSVARAAAIGIFVGLLPLIGLQILVSILASYFLRANITLAAVATFISNPFTTGAIILMQIKLGEWLIPGETVKTPLDMGISQYFALYGKSLLVGSMVTAIVGGILAYPATLWLWRIGERAAKKRRQKSV